MECSKGHASKLEIYTQKIKKMSSKIKAKQGCKTITDLDMFSINYKAGQNMQRIGKTLAEMSIKCECLRCYVAKRPYLDGSLCQFIYEHIEHANKHGELCHGQSDWFFIMRWGLIFLKNETSYKTNTWLGVIFNSNHEPTQSRVKRVGEA